MHEVIAYEFYCYDYRIVTKRITINKIIKTGAGLYVAGSGF